MNAKQSEIAELLPKATVVRKSDDYITVLDDSFTVESISEEGRCLSEQLPQTVVFVGMENDEALGIGRKYKLFKNYPE